VEVSIGAVIAGALGGLSLVVTLVWLGSHGLFE